MPRAAWLTACPGRLMAAMVWPSGFDRFRMVTEFLPPAPGTFRITTGTPRAFDITSPWSLAAVSMAPPTENPTRMVMGLPGFHLSAAVAGVATSASAPATSSTSAVFPNVPRIRMMDSFRFHKNLFRKTPSIRWPW